MAELNSWYGYGTIMEEPVAKFISDDCCVAHTILAMKDNVTHKLCYLPISAYNKKAHILCSLAHRGSKVYCKGTIVTKVRVTSVQAKKLIELTFKLNDFVVLEKKAIEDIGEKQFVDVAQMYDPETFMDINDEEEVENNG